MEREPLVIMVLLSMLTVCVFCFMYSSVLRGEAFPLACVLSVRSEGWSGRKGGRQSPAAELDSFLSFHQLTNHWN